jgi:Protein of unknown function (DUF3465)
VGLSGWERARWPNALLVLAAAVLLPFAAGCGSAGASGRPVLVAQNIDLAPGITGLRVGDLVAFRGVYEWNPEGGTVHWTLHDPSDDHPAGWLRHGRGVYE